MRGENETGPPLGWVVTTVAEVTAPVAKVDAAQSPDRDIRYIDIGSIDNQRNKISDAKTVRLSEAPSRARQIVKFGDVLFATIRPYLRNIAQVPESLDGEIASTGFAVLRPAQGVEQKYLFYKSISHDFVAALTGEQYGVSYPAVKDDQVRAQSFELPPTAEQCRIGAKIEELFSELDRGVESLTTAREQLKVYRQSVLKHAFEGKLTEHWRAKNGDKLESPAALLDRIKKERETRYKAVLDDWQAALVKWRADGEKGRKPAKPKQPVPITLATSNATKRLPELPPGWSYFLVGSLCEVVRGGSPRPAGDERYYNGDIPFLKVADLTRTSGMFVDSSTYTIKEAGLTKTRQVDPQTLLISNSGATLGVPKICRIRATFNDGVAAFLGLSAEENSFHYWFWVRMTPLLRNINQGAAQPNLNTSLLAESIIPQCSLTEQAEILRILDSKLESADVMDAEIDAALARADSLRQSILKRAFSGKLVPQSPADEPASVLLDRIRAEREATTPKTRKRRDVRA